MQYAEIYQLCKDSYNRMYDNLRNCLFDYQREMMQEGKLFPADEISDKFEIIFQFSCFQVLGTCGKVSLDEARVIRDITKEKDVIEYLQSFKDNCYGWDDIIKLGQENLDMFINQNKGLILALCLDIIDDCAHALYKCKDKTFNINYICMQLTDFLINLLNVDNDAQKRSYDNNLLLETLAKIRNRINEIRREEKFKK